MSPTVSYQYPAHESNAGLGSSYVMMVGNQSSQKCDHITIYTVSSRLGSSYVLMVAGGRQKKKTLKRRSRHQMVNTKRLAASGKRTISNIHYNQMKLTSYVGKKILFPLVE